MNTRFAGLLGFPGGSVPPSSLLQTNPPTRPPRTHQRAMQGIKYWFEGEMKFYEGPFLHGEPHGEARPLLPKHGCHWPELFSGIGFETLVNQTSCWFP